MGRNRRIKTSEMNCSKEAAEISLSASSSGKMMSKRKRQNNDENENEQGELEKKSRTESESTPEVEILCEVEAKKFSINDLPSEMLMKILINLNFQSLLHCRLMSRHWNWIATEVSRSRSDLCIQFDCFREDKKLVIVDQMRQTKTSLASFVENFGSSTNFPFAHFQFNGVVWPMFHKKEWTKFLSLFGERIKGLKFSNTSIYRINSVLKLGNELTKLLLNQLPKLQEFGLQLVKCDPNSSKIHLFPKPPAGFDSPIPTSTSTGKEKDERTQLVHLKVLYLDGLMFSGYTGIAMDLLLAAVKLVKIQPFKTGDCYRSTKKFKFLQSLGKLGCVQSAEMDLTSNFLSNINNKNNKKKNNNNNNDADEPAVPLVFKLKRLNLYMGFTQKNPIVWSDATIYLSNLLESNKNCLRELTMDPLGFLEDLPLPQFTSLNNLSIGKRNAQKIKESIFPPGIELNFIFPVLTSLELEIPWKTAFPQEDFISPIPTLRRLKIVGDYLNETSIAQISFMCPDLKDFCICDGRKGPLRKFSEVGSAIWTHLKKLQALELNADVCSRANSFPAIDSCITGFSEENFQRLYDCIKADKMLRKWGLEGRVSPSEMAAERQNPSVLELKDLKKFTIGLALRDIAVDDDEQDLLGKAMTFVSEEHAFKLMDGLNYEIKRYSINSPSPKVTVIIV